ncbi:dCMP deaminase family protein [Candidatus Dependentiae bacterium]|nr:dCMP deaminase family protein [Candidatus Dependentiae bacterium]
MTRQEKLDQNFLRLAWMTALNLSKDPMTQVGAIITSGDSRQVSLGYNGFPAGAKETPERWQRPEKYEWAIHAEMNAVINAPFDTKGCTVYVTHQPCHRCLAHLVNAGIKRVIYYTPKPDDRPDIFAELSNLFEEVACVNKDEFIELLKITYDNLNNKRA